MFTVLLGQWHFSEARIIASHSLSVNVLILSGFMEGEDCVAFVMLKRYINIWLTGALFRKKVGLH